MKIFILRSGLTLMVLLSLLSLFSFQNLQAQGLFQAYNLSPDKSYSINLSEENPHLIVMSRKKIRATLKGTSRILSAKFSYDSKNLLVTREDGTFSLWDNEKGYEIYQVRGHQRAINYGEFSHDNKKIVTASDDKNVIIWDAISGKKIKELRGRHRWNPLGSGHTSFVVSAKFNGDDTLILTASDDSTAIVWSVENGKALFKLKGHSELIVTAGFNEPLNLIYTLSWDRTVRIWNIKDGKLQAILKGHTSSINSIEFSEDGNQILTGSWDRTAILWDSLTGEKIMIFKTGRPVMLAHFVKSSHKIVTLHDQHPTLLWDEKSGERILILPFLWDQTTGLLRKVETAE